MTDWVRNEYSRGQVDRAGERLAQGIKDDQVSWVKAYQIMDNWRTSHAFPLNTIQVSLRRRAYSIDPAAIVALRLKRAPSIISKLEREPKMKLSQMQDIGGCRSVLRSSENVYNLRELYQQARDRHEISNEKDYIQLPRESGYRGLHIIYKYKSDRNVTYNNHRIEMQVRTEVQHAWATSVEIVGLFTNAPLKSSIGPEKWLEFFKWASSSFSLIEGTPPLHQGLSQKAIIEGLREIEEELGACAALQRFSATYKVLREQTLKKSVYYLLSLNVEKSELTVGEFYSLQEASEAYAEAEADTSHIKHIDVVLVSSENLDMVAKAYPNYFVDTRTFVSLVRHALEDI